MYTLKVLKKIAEKLDGEIVAYYELKLEISYQ